MGEIGIALRNFSSPEDGQPDVEGLIRMARRAEELGLDIVWTWDHVILGSRKVFPILDPFLLLSAISSRTHRVKLGTMLLVSLRNPVQLAKEIATLDYISRGRLMIGGIAGWYEREFKAMGVEYSKRGRLLERNFSIIRELLANNSVTMKVDNLDLDNVTIEPKSLQRPSPLMLMGGYSDNVLRRIAKLADGWVSYCYTPESFRANWGKILQYAREYGRDQSSLTNLAIIPLCVSKDREVGMSRLKAFASKGYLDFPSWSSATLDSSIVGGVEECRDRLTSYFENGMEKIVLVPCDYDLEQIEVLGKELVPGLIKR
ncbi:MAG: LLM class flavin-dependent oxidoreductase [Aigarchaeota archaeon]|nr:LLM class flavin-dependent oxidoreductase [Aigarchaeota archaeon]MDW8092949.1 LLM class flavin-dependent oxidoreductase [Nitrososphaerota archaeon]